MLTFTEHWHPQFLCYLFICALFSYLSLFISLFAQIILAFGNYMNSFKRGAVYGFKLQSLDMVSTWLSFKSYPIYKYLLLSGQGRQIFTLEFARPNLRVDPPEFDSSSNLGWADCYRRQGIFLLQGGRDFYCILTAPQGSSPFTLSITQ